jgi:hypothetical protein
VPENGTVFPETSLKLLSLRCVKFQKGEDVIYTYVEIYHALVKDKVMWVGNLRIKGVGLKMNGNGNPYHLKWKSID